MNLEEALRFTEIALAFAFLVQSIEHLRTPNNERYLFGARIILSLWLMTGYYSQWASVFLLMSGIIMLHRFQGPYNGGSDRMGLLILTCVCGTHLIPAPWKEYAFGYLSIQLVLSYVISGWVKIKNPEWRSGRALQDVFQFSAYPITEATRNWANHPRLLWSMSWAVMLFELLFPLALWTQETLIIGLVIAGGFHLANACLFGLNRFFWVWIAAYPSILWLQERIMGGG